MLLVPAELKEDAQSLVAWDKTSGCSPVHLTADDL